MIRPPLERLASKDLGEREGALRELGMIAGDDGLALRPADAAEEARFESAFAVAAMRDPRGLEILLAALGTPARRLDACDGLHRLGSPEAIPALRRVSKSFFLGWSERLAVWATLYSLGE